MCSGLWWLLTVRLPFLVRPGVAGVWWIGLLALGVHRLRVLGSLCGTWFAGRNSWPHLVVMPPMRVSLSVSQGYHSGTFCSLDHS